jgi:hypothetical protein
MSAGYRSATYAESFGEFGRPVWLPGARGWLIRRQIPGVLSFDAMGCYPVFSCEDWSALGDDLVELEGQVVAVSLVTDPFGDFEVDTLRRSFPDRITLFKQHHIVDLPGSGWSTLSKHHRYSVKRALERVRVEAADAPVAHLDEWLDLYGVLVERHRLRGIKAFSRPAFERQLSAPGAVLLRALAGGEVVGAHIWYVDGDVGYSHLAATSEKGYERSASYALYWRAFEHLRDRVRWLDLGAGGGMDASAGAGLDAFKRGFATGTRPAYFCGRIYDRRRYQEITRRRGDVDPSYFPAYRTGELV